MEQRAERGVNEQVGPLGEDEGLKADVEGEGETGEGEKAGGDASEVKKSGGTGWGVGPFVRYLCIRLFPSFFFFAKGSFASLSELSDPMVKIGLSCVTFIWPG
jgi:hypothetical protein